MTARMNEKVCPWWVGYFLVNPMRRVFQDPIDILNPYIHKGMTVLDVGSAMGYFSLPMARLVGDTGRVVCVDMQERMIRTLKKRAATAQLSSRTDVRVCTQTSLQIDDLAGTIDFALAFAVVHEVPDPKRFLSEILQSMKRNGHLLISEPKGHVTQSDLAGTISMAQTIGFNVAASPEIRWSLSVLLTRP